MSPVTVPAGKKSQPPTKSLKSGGLLLLLFIDKNSSHPRGKLKTLPCKALGETEGWLYLKKEILNSAHLVRQLALICFLLVREGAAGYELCCSHLHVGGKLWRGST